MLTNLIAFIRATTCVQGYWCTMHMNSGCNISVTQSKWCWKTLYCSNTVGPWTKDHPHEADRPSVRTHRLFWQTLQFHGRSQPWCLGWFWREAPLYWKIKRGLETLTVTAQGELRQVLMHFYLKQRRGLGWAKITALYPYAPNTRKVTAAECYAWRHTIPPGWTQWSHRLQLTSVQSGLPVE